MNTQIDAAWKAGYLTGFKDLALQLADKICDVSDILMEEYEYTDRIDAACTALTTVLEMIADLSEATSLQFMPQGKEGAQ